MCLYTFTGYKGTWGSLTFGGFDYSRLIPHNITFNQGPDFSTPFLASLVSLTGNLDNGSLSHELSSNEGLVSLDSSTPYLWLSNETCARFEDTFGIVWDEKTEFYYPQNSSLPKNFSIDIKLADSSNSQNESVTITLPFSALDLELDHSALSLPASVSKKSYFPLKRLPPDGQPTLGRVFFQEACVSSMIVYNRTHTERSVDIL